MKFPGKGLYAITQTEGKSQAQIISAVSAALQGGAQVIQYRDKNPSDAVALSARLRQICHRYNAPFIINDDIDLAIEISADGVHLGRDDANIMKARKVLGNDAIIGISCYDDVEKARRMEAAGADYVAFGRFFPSTSKPLASPAQIETLHKARQSIHIPVVAIGGITPANGGQLLAAGADLLAVIGGVFDQNDPAQAAADFNALFNRVSP
jgi:thiamine-phosphate pyrophosphorylase